MKHTISLKVRNYAGVMSHVSGLFTRRGFNIDSIAVGETNYPEVSVITIVVRESDQKLAQIINQLRKLIDVIDVHDLAYNESVTRELALITVDVQPNERPEVLGIVEVFGGKIDDMSEDSIMIEVSGNSRQIKAMINLLEKYGIKEIVRTGQIAMSYQQITA